jgi:lipopolysaccharide/colanic/teichoic acid biosynthesis glycosyltransferase
LLIIFVLRLSGEGEIFYVQQRVGRHGKLFPIYKFATMLKNSPNLYGGDITIGNDPRILPFGRFLRTTKLNELPQLFNILLGDMSVIGWRPLTPRVAQLFPKSHWDAVKNTSPGLSGVGSIVFRNEEFLLNSATDRDALYASVIAPAVIPIWYARHQSFFLISDNVGDYRCNGSSKLISTLRAASLHPGSARIACTFDCWIGFRT